MNSKDRTNIFLTVINNADKEYVQRSLPPITQTQFEWARNIAECASRLDFISPQLSKEVATLHEIAEEMLGNRVGEVYASTDDLWRVK
jgi:hypothetical protein